MCPNDIFCHKSRNYDKQCLLECLNILSKLPFGTKTSLASNKCIKCILPIAQLLSGIGAVSVDGESITIKSFTSLMFIKSLTEYVDNNIEILSGWEETKGRPNEITEKNILLSEIFLYAMERKRISLLGTAAKELRTNSVVRVIFKAKINGKDNYLMQYDSVAKQYQLIGGYIDYTDKDAIAAAIREISEELPEADFDYNMNYKLREVYKTKQVEKAISNTYCVYSAYEVIALFAYDVDNAVLHKIDPRQNAWVSLEEIVNGKARDGRKVFRISQEMQDAMRTSDKSFTKSKFLLSKLLSDRRIQITGLAVAIIGLIFTILAFFIK